MGKWGPGLLQNDDDADIAADLETMFGFPLTPPFASPTPSTAEAPAFDHATTAAKLNTDGLLQRKFARILEQTFVPRSASHKRQRVAVVLGMLAMQTGAVLSDEHLMALRVLHRTLPTLEQQMQLLAALDGYANDGITRWISGSKTFAETCGEKGGKANPFWYSGLGYIYPPFSIYFSHFMRGCGG
ncbi:hypothetical protein GGS21DRAFT_526995 [Xylaria nigripes]|nr:hypothetical protein GGS21DRAFT_526995 [Xylaria nigripes]